MGFQAKRLFKKIISWSGLFFFAVAAYMIYRQLSAYKLSDIHQALMSIPMENLILSGIACVIGYIVLSCYDYLALQYIHRPLHFFKWMVAGIIGFSVSNNAGHAVVSGGAIRYRLYTRWRFKGIDIVKMVMFSGFTYLLGCFFLVILGYMLMSHEAFKNNSASYATIMLTMMGSIAGLAVYFTLAVFYKKPVHIKGVSFKMPSVKMGIAQITVGTLDSLFASLVLYFVLIQFVNVPFGVFLGVFVIAQVLGVFSQVPGGLGVFETMFILLLPGDHKVTEIYGALIAYRIIYYLLPLIVSGVMMLAVERKWMRFRFEHHKQAHEPKHHL